MTPDMPVIFWGFRLLLVISACYRLSKLISEDDGPFFVFEQLRVWAKDKAYLEAKENDALLFDLDAPDGEIDPRWYGFWHSVSEGISCPYCVGIWLSVPLFLMLLFPSQLGDLFLVFVFISAGQAFLQGLKR